MSAHTTTSIATGLVAKITSERMDSHAFDRSATAIEGIELAATLGIPEALPVGSLMAVTREARLLDEALGRHRAIRIPGVPVIRQTRGGQGKHPGGETLALDPGQHEKRALLTRRWEFP